MRIGASMDCVKNLKVNHSLRVFAGTVVRKIYGTLWFEICDDIDIVHSSANYETAATLAPNRRELSN